MSIAAVAEAMRNEPLRDARSGAFRGARPAGVIAAYLLGTHARRQAHHDSDIEVGILLDRTQLADSRARFERRVALTSWLIGAAHHDEIDVVILNDAPPRVLARHIVTRGQLLYCTEGFPHPRVPDLACIGTWAGTDQ